METLAGMNEEDRGGLGPRTSSTRIRLALAAVLVAQACAFIADSSETFDEPTFLRLGIDVFRAGDFRGFASPMDPALPVLLEYPLAALSSENLPDTPGWSREVPVLIRRARLTTALVVGVPLVWFVHAWLARRRGAIVAALGGGMLALSPSVVAASALATTDACAALFVLVALGTFAVYIDRPSWRNLALMGVGLGLAFGAKQSTVFLIPVLALELLLDVPSGPTKGTEVDRWLAHLARRGGRLAWVAVIAFVVDWATFGFEAGPKFRTGSPHMPLPIAIPMVLRLLPNGEALLDAALDWSAPLPLETFFGLLDKATTAGHPAYLHGERSSHGFWLFFPTAILLKSTPAELFVVGLAAARLFRRSSWVDPAARLWMTSTLALLAFAIASPLNYGHRHVLPLYPLAVLLAFDLLGGLPRRGVLLGSILVAGQFSSIVSIAPQYPSYFNLLGGGPVEGHRFLVDSSLDWGQELPALRRALEERHYHKVLLHYFGTADPAIHGIRAVGWQTPEDPVEAGCDWAAISVTYLHGAYDARRPPIEWLGGLPHQRAGYGVFLYDLRDPRIRAAIESCRKS